MVYLYRMNFLAHAYLSFGNKEILLGNMISDFVKGSQQYRYPSVIHKGIVLHRCIDSFTDAHPVTKEAKEVFRSEYRLYSGAFVDVVYDHFLAKDLSEFNTEEELRQFAQQCYQSLNTQQQWMPKQFARMFQYMKTQDWFSNYRSQWGIMRSFNGLVMRSSFLHDASKAGVLLQSNYDFLENCFLKFWKDLKPFAKNKLEELINT